MNWYWPISPSDRQHRGACQALGVPRSWFYQHKDGHGRRHLAQQQHRAACHQVADRP